MPDIASYEQNANQNYKEILSSSKNLQTINAREDVEKREPCCSVGGNVNGYSHYGKQYGDFSPWVS